MEKSESNEIELECLRATVKELRQTIKVLSRQLEARASGQDAFTQSLIKDLDRARTPQELMGCDSQEPTWSGDLPLVREDFPPDCKDGEWCKECYKCYSLYVQRKMAGELDD